MSMSKMHLEIIERLDRIEAALVALEKKPPLVSSTARAIPADKPTQPPAPRPKKK